MPLTPLPLLCSGTMDRWHSFDNVLGSLDGAQRVEDNDLCTTTKSSAHKSNTSSVAQQGFVERDGRSSVSGRHKSAI